MTSSLRFQAEILVFGGYKKNEPPLSPLQLVYFCTTCESSEEVFQTFHKSKAFAKAKCFPSCVKCQQDDLPKQEVDQTITEFEGRLAYLVVALDSTKERCEAVT